MGRKLLELIEVMMPKKIILSLLFCLVAWPAFADDAAPSQEKWFIGPRIGFSGFTSIAGMNVQYRHVGLTIGAVPYTLGARYFFRAPKHSWFLGVVHRTFSESEYIDINGERIYRPQEIGGGFGHMWRWGSGWDLEFDVTVASGRGQNARSSPTTNKSYVILRPGIAFGYSF